MRIVMYEVVKSSKRGSLFKTSSWVTEYDFAICDSLVQNQYVSLQKEQEKVYVLSLRREILDVDLNLGI